MQDLRQAEARQSPQRQQAFAQLQLAAQLFDASSATSIDAPGWGHAEAYLALGRELQSRGDQLGARNWIEKSLIAAPDYKAAQRQLALLVRPRSVAPPAERPCVQPGIIRRDEATRHAVIAVRDA